MDDLISRQQALALRFTKAINEDGVIYVPLGEYLSGIKSLTSTQPDESTCWGCNCPKMDLLEQPTQTNADPMQGSALDCVRRQQAIDAVNAATVITNPEHFKGHEKFTGFMEDEDILSFGKWERANGFNTALVETRILLEKLPYAQPDMPEFIEHIESMAYERGRSEAQSGKKRGHWKLLDNGDAICSECGRKQKGVWDFDNWDNFCRHCGADMRG